MINWSYVIACLNVEGIKLLTINLDADSGDTVLDGHRFLLAQDLSTLEHVDYRSFTGSGCELAAFAESLYAYAPNLKPIKGLMRLDQAIRFDENGVICHGIEFR